MLGVDIDFQQWMDRIYASWSGFSDLESGIASYEWAIGTEPGFDDVLHFVDVGTSTDEKADGLTLETGTTYFVTVRARNGSGLSVQASSDGVAVDAIPPAAPAGLVATPGDGQVILTWSANSEPDLAGYEVYMGPSPGTKINAGLVPSSPTPSYLVTGLTNGETYMFAIVAVDMCGNRSPFSEPASATPCADTIPPTFTAFSLYDLSSNHADWTNSQTVGVSMSADGTGGPVIRWLLKQIAAPPTVEEMLAALTSQPSNYTTASPDGQITVYAWVMDSAQNISAAAQYTIGLDTVLPVTRDFSLEDSTSGSPDYTDSLTVTLSATASDANPIVRWIFVNDPVLLDTPPTESQMWNNGLTEPPTTWEFPPDTPAGDLVLGAWRAAGVTSLIIRFTSVGLCCSRWQHGWNTMQFDSGNLQESRFD
jgi:hypothetical protein